MSLLPDLPADTVLGDIGEFLDPASHTLVENTGTTLLAEAYPNGVPRRGKLNSYVTIYDRVYEARAGAGAATGAGAAIGA